MHSKQKGNVGSTATILALQKLSWNVFVELGDYSKVDLIAEKDGKTIKIQVKYCKYQEKKGNYILSMKKSGPNGYRYTYQDQDLDVFSVYLPDEEKVVFIPKSKIAGVNSFTLRKLLARNNQKKCNQVDDFRDLNKVLESFCT